MRSAARYAQLAQRFLAGKPYGGSEWPRAGNEPHSQLIAKKVQRFNGRWGSPSERAEDLARIQREIQAWVDATAKPPRARRARAAVNA